MTRVKICGIGHPEHGLAALEGGADLLGFIFYPPSHRYVTPERAGEIIEACRKAFPHGWRAVGVFVNVSLEAVSATAETAALDLVQLAGEEDPFFCAEVARPVVKVVRMRADGTPTGPVEASAWNAERVLLDTARAGHYGGTGERYEWRAARPYAREALLAGGLNSTNARRAIAQAQPWGLDVSSGVERDRQKDPELIRRFLSEVKQHGDG